MNFVFLLACQGTSKDSTITDSKVEVLDDTGGTEICSAHNNILLLPFDGWGHSLDIEWFEGDLEVGNAWGVSGGRISFDERAQSLSLPLHHEEHLDMTLNIQYDGGNKADAFLISLEGAGQWVSAWNDDPCPELQIFVGMEHRYFASSGASPSMNRIDFFVDGASFWEQVAQDIISTEERLLWTG